MAYVDLNPIRAGITDTPLAFEFTSIRQRLDELAQRKDLARIGRNADTPVLLAFLGTQRQDSPGDISFNLQDYFDLIDTTGRVVRADQRGAIADQQPTLLATLGVAPEEWFKTVTQRQSRFERFVGAPHHLRSIADKRGWRWVRGLAAARRLYAKANA